MAIGYQGDIAEDGLLYWTFNTMQTDGTPFTLAGTPSLAVYKDADDAEDTTGLTLAVDFDSVTGLNHVSVDSSDGFYATGADYSVVVAAGTVDGTSVVGTVIGSFSIENRFAEVDVTKIGGDAQSLADLKDFTDAGYDPATSSVALVDLVSVTSVNSDMVAAAPTATQNRDAILDDSTRFSGAKIDASISSRGTGDGDANAGDAMNLAPDAIKAVSFDESTAFPVVAADAGNTQIARVGADGDTLETLSDQIDLQATATALTTLDGVVTKKADVIDVLTRDQMLKRQHSLLDGDVPEPTGTTTKRVLFKAQDGTTTEATKDIILATGQRTDI